jgi:DNA-binding PadR family transcriptional regulator
MLRHVLLALLADGSPHHGYALMKAYAERSGIRLSIGNVYRELQHLVVEGLIAVTRNPEGADPRRTPYVITARGRAVLGTWLDGPSDVLVAAGPDPLAYRLAVLSDLEPAAVATFLDELHHELHAEAKRVERERAAVPPRDRESRVARTRALLLGRRARHLAVEREMLQEMERMLDASGVPSLVAEDAKPPRRAPRRRQRADDR